LLSRNHRIGALVRSPQRASNLPAGVTSVQGTIENPDSYRGMLRGYEVFVHMAALVKMWVRDRKDFDRINVEALRNAVQLSADAGVKKFVYTSSFIALGPSNGEPLSELHSRRSDHFHNDYERTKYLGDQVARKFVQEGYPLYILYPGVIYGPGNLTDGNIIAKNVIPFLNGKMPFGLGIKTWSYAFIRDVVMNIPMSLAAVAGYCEYLLAQLFGREPSLMTHEVVGIYKHSWTYSSSLAIRELGYRITPLKEGLIQMVSWLKNAGLVK